jgi:hypothetical protein
MVAIWGLKTVSVCGISKAIPLASKITLGLVVAA